MPPLLFNLVFGESVLNDAVAIVLFRTLEDYHATPMTLQMLPRMCGRFLFIGIGSLVAGGHPSRPFSTTCTMLACLQAWIIMR